MNERFVATVAVVAVASLAACTSTSPRYATGSAAGAGPNIRVLLDQTPATVVVRATGPFAVRSREGVGITSADAGATVEISRNENTLQVRIDPGATVAAAEDEVWLVPRGAGEFELGGTRYPGSIRATAWGRTTLVVNVVGVERYLEGVIPHEIGDPGPDAYAAVQAQAITARTYALTRIGQRAQEPFDVFAGVRDQVYRGSEGSSRTAASAVRDTRGLVLVHGGELASTYYSATCGGHTSDIRSVWPRRRSESYLHGRRDRDQGEGAFCSWVHNFRWRHSFSGRELGEILRQTIPAELGVPAARVGYLRDMRVLERSASGRVRVLLVETTAGQFRVQGDRIRWVLMPDPARKRILPSTLFDIEKRLDGGRVSSIGIVGGGNGHGVGMCQNGAVGMARRGYSHRMILSHYYPGTALAKRY